MGILTGDVKVNPHAPVVVMTTEILRNALYGSGFDNLGYIVLDECHYMGDEGRGTVWEEIIISAPQGRRAGRAVGHGGQRQGDRRLDLARAPADRGHRPSAPAGAAALLGGRPRRPDPRDGRRAARPRPRDRRRAARPGRSLALVHAPCGRSDRADRGAGAATLAAGHLLHLQPGRLRASDGGRARQQPPAASRASSAARWTNRSPRRWPTRRPSASRS